MYLLVESEIKTRSNNLGQPLGTHVHVTEIITQFCPRLLYLTTNITVIVLLATCSHTLNGVCCLAAIPGSTALVPSHVVKFL